MKTKSKKKTNKRRYRNLQQILFASILTLGVLSTTLQDVEAAQPDSYTIGQVNKAYWQSGDYYYMDGYVYYQSYSWQSPNPATYYENSTSYRWTESTPKLQPKNSFYNPEDVDGKREMHGTASEWGFSTQGTTWNGSRLYSPTGIPTNKSVRYSRYTRTRYRRTRTKPTTKGVSDPSSNIAVKGNNYWVKPGATIQLTVNNFQDWNGSKNLPLKDYVNKNWIRFTASGVDARANMGRDGAFSYSHKVTSHFDITKNTSSITNSNKQSNARFNVVPKQAGKTYNILTYAASENGNNTGYVDTGKDLKTDGNAPTKYTGSVTGARYQNGNDYWFRPGDSFVVRTSAFDDESGVRDINLGLTGDGNDNRAVHNFSSHGNATVNEFRTTGGYTSITSGNSPYYGQTAQYDFNGKVNSNAGNRTFNIQHNIRDYVGNVADYTNTGLRIRTDATAPTTSVTGNPSAWTNQNATVTVTGTDGQSGMKHVRNHAGTWTNGNKASQTFTANGTYTFIAEDNVGRQTTQTVTVNRIDKTLPTGSITGNPTAWTKNNVTLTFTGSDGQSGVKRVRQAGGTWVNGNETTITVTANGTYSFEVEDNAGNVRTVSATVNSIDKTAPNGSITGNPTAWTKDNATLTFTGTDSGSGVKRVRQSGGTWVNGATTTRTVSANGTYSFEVEDNVGNVRTVSATVNRIDKTAPNGTISGNPTAWTKNNATLTFTGTDSGGAGVKRVRQAGGSWVNGSTTSMTVSANGTYSFEVEDNAGNVRTVSATVNRIDKTLPNGTISGNPTSWTKNNATLTFNATDSGGAGVKRVRQAGGSWVNGSTTSMTVSSNGTYSFEVEDNAGNVRTVSVAVNRIDKTVPGGTISGNPTAWTKNNATLTFTGTDSGGAGVKRVRQAGGSWVNGSTTSMTVSSNGTYSFEVEDNAGNVKTISVAVNRIDKTVPGGTISGNPTAWTNNNVTLTFNGTDSGGAGVKRVRQAGGSWVNGSTTSMTVSSNGTYSFEVEDNAGNVKTISATVNRIDKVLPQNKGATVYDARYVNGNDHWVRPGDKFRVEVTGFDDESTMRYTYLRFSGDGNDNRAYHNWELADGHVEEFSTTGGFTSITGGSAPYWGWTPRYMFNAQANSTAGNRTFQVHSYFTDRAGNVVGYVDTGKRVRTDATAPTISANIGSREWGNGNVSVALTHSDAQSGINTKQFKWSTSTATPTSWDAYTGTTTQSNAGTWYLHARAVDNVGHVTTQRFGPYRIDKTNPTLSASPASRGWGNSNVSVALTHADDLSGVATKQYKWSTSTATPTAWDTYSSAVTQSTAGTWYLHARVVDNAGNVHTQRFGTYLIDKTAPGGTISGNPTAWTNGNATLTFNATDSGGSGVKRVRQAGGTWVNGATTTMTVSSNGTYSFEVEDNAGNTKTVSIAVNRIDKTVPGGTISGNPTAWTNKDVTLTFNATDSGGAGVKRVRKPDGTWVNGSTTSQVVSNNGTYTFRAEDNAGNIKDVSASVTKIDKTLPGATTQQTPTAWTNKPVEIDVHATDSQSGIKTIEQIGGAGQNLIKNSNFATGSLADWYNNGSVVYAKVDGKDVAKFTTTTQGIYQYAAPNTARYTISLKAKAKASSTNMRVGYLNTAYHQTFGLTTDWKEYTFTTSANVPAGQLFHIYGVGKEFYVTDVKIEQGTSKTPYTVASQDSTQGGRPNLFKQSDSLGSHAPYHASWSKTNANTYETTLNSGYLTLQIPTLHNTVKGGGYTFSGYLYVNGKPIPTSSTKRFSTYYSSDAKVEVREDGYFVMEIPNNTSGWIFHMPPAYVGAKLGDKFTVKYPKVQSGTVEEATSYKPASGDTGLNADMRTFEAPVNGTYSFRTTDVAGNVRDVTHSVSNIDLVDPNGTISGNPTAWTNQNVTLTFNATDSGGSGVKRVRQAGGTWVNGSTTNMTVSVNGTYSFEVEDDAGNTKTVSVVVNRIDKTVPGGTISGNPSAWTNKDVTLTFNATDSGGAGVKRVKTPDGTWVDGAKATYTVSTNGTYSFVAEDNAGNQKTVSVVVNRIDKSLPTLEITGNPANWVGTDVTLTIKASDTGGSGVKHIVLPNGSIINGSETTYTIPSNGKFTFKVVDVAGNERSYTIDVTKIDKTNPTGNIAPSTTNWTNQNVTLSVTTADSQSGIKEIVKPDGTKATTATTTFIVERNGTYTFTIYDRVNNKMTKTIKVSNIDKEAPSETIIEIEK